jgi:hypothetical protein
MCHTYHGLGKKRGCFETADKKIAQAFFPKEFLQQTACLQPPGKVLTPL